MFEAQDDGQFGTTKGLFFAHFLAMAQKRLQPADLERLIVRCNFPRRISAFTDYPIVPLTLFQEHLAERFFPTLPLAAGMGELGREAFTAFAQSTAGRVTTALVTFDARLVASIMDRTYRSLNKLGDLTVLTRSNREFVLQFRRYAQYPEHQHGIVDEGCLQLHWAVRPELVELRFERFGPGRVRGDFDIVMRQ